MGGGRRGRAAASDGDGGRGHKRRGTPEAATARPGTFPAHAARVLETPDVLNATIEEKEDALVRATSRGKGAVAGIIKPVIEVHPPSMRIFLYIHQQIKLTNDTNTVQE